MSTPIDSGSARTSILITFPDYTVKAGVPLHVKPVQDEIALVREVLEQLDAPETGARPALKLDERLVMVIKQLSSLLPITVRRLVDPELPGPTEWVYQASSLEQVSVRELQAAAPDDGSGHIAAAHRTARERIDDATEHAELVASAPRIPATLAQKGDGLPRES